MAKKKAYEYINYDDFNNIERFRSELIFTQGVRQNNIKNVKFGERC